MSNLGLTPTGSLGVGSDSWIAQQFFSEYNANNTSAYVVTSVQLLMDPGSGNPGGFTVSIYSGSSGPQKDLGALSGPNPSAGGLFTYTSSGITLLPYNNINPPTDYFIVVTGATPVGQGAYAWSAESGHGDTVGNNNWFIDDVYYSSVNGVNWTGTVRQDVFQFAVNVVPEPSLSLLFLIGIGVMVLHPERTESRRTTNHSGIGVGLGRFLTSSQKN